MLLNRKGAPGYYIGVALLRRNGNKFQLSEPMEPQAILNDTEILKGMRSANLLNIVGLVTPHSPSQ